MATQTILRIRQDAPREGVYPIRLRLERPGLAALEAEAQIEFALSPQEQGDLRWYMEDYLMRADTVEQEVVAQIEASMVDRGEELYRKVLAHTQDTQAIWFAVREQLADLRVEITTGIAEAASIPWELMRDPQSDSPIALRVAEFVRVQSNANISFVAPPPSAGDGERVRLLYVVCRPNGSNDVGMRAVANRLFEGLGKERDRFDITALRPPTFAQLQTELTDAKAAGRPYHIVHFDGHGIYADLSGTTLAGWGVDLSPLRMGGANGGKQGYLLFEQPDSRDGMRPVAGGELGKLLHDTGVPILVLNACQSAMHEATERPQGAADAHDEVRAIGSLAQAVIDQGIPGVLGMRYSVFVVTAAQYIGELYAGLGKGRSFGWAANQARKHLHRNPDRWVGLNPRPLQDWFVPVIYEAMPLALLAPRAAPTLGGGLGQPQTPSLDPVQANPALVRYVPDTGFVGRDETLLMLDRAFDAHPVVLLHAYAGQGKTSTAVEFARWLAQTGGLDDPPVVLFTSFEQPTTLADALAQVGQTFGPLLQANNIDWHAINDPAERQSLVIQLLRLVPVLWIWDNVEGVAGFPTGAASQWTAAEQQALADFLKLIVLDKTTQARVLLTSRRDERGWLGGVPHRVAMPRMAPADAAILARQLGQERNLGRAEMAGWQPLLDYCAGNPLTLRVLVGQAVKTGLRGEAPICTFVQAVRDGEQTIHDADAAQGRDRSLGASLDYGFRNVFQDDELPIIALLHLFQGTVPAESLANMGVGEQALAEVQGRTLEYFSSLLDRATETGLLTHLGSTYYTIHPALPWFLGQLFANHYSGDYDGEAGRSSAQAALRAWVEAVGELGDYYFWEYVGGNREVIQFLALEEANLIHARRLARRHGWWRAVISAMQGLRELYAYQGRGGEWARLVAKIVPDFCTAQDGPILGREEQYSLVMGYRVDLAHEQERNLALAAGLQEKLVDLHRQQAAPALALAADVPLDGAQHNHIRTLGVTVTIYAQILSEQGSTDCVAQYEASIELYKRIGDTAGEAISHYNLGHAYMDLPAIRDLDAAEAAYQRSLELRPPSDALDQSKSIKQIGMVHHERFREARQHNAPPDTQLAHFRAAERHFKHALALCPPTAIADLGPFHNQLGNLYQEVGQTEVARQHYEQAADFFERSGNRYHTGSTRFNLALMYRDSAGSEASPARQGDLLRRGWAYAQAALRDFQSFQGRAAGWEARAQGLIDEIEAALQQLS